MKTKHKTLTALIKSRKFDWVDPDIEKNFALEDIRSSDYKLYRFDRIIASEKAIAEMEKDGYAPANLTELLSWDGWDEKDWVVALDSVTRVDGGRLVPVLWEHASGRDLNLCWFDRSWYRGCRFLAVRTDSGTQTSELKDLGTLKDALTLRVENLEQTMNAVLDALGNTESV